MSGPPFLGEAVFYLGRAGWASVLCSADARTGLERASSTTASSVSEALTTGRADGKRMIDIQALRGAEPSGCVDAKSAVEVRTTVVPGSPDVRRNTGSGVFFSSASTARVRAVLHVYL